MSTQDRKLPIDTQFDYDKLIDMKADQLDAMVKECEITMERLRADIVKNYQKAQPYLMQMRLLKQQIKKVTEKMEAAKTFLSMEKNGSLVSSIDLVELKKSVGGVDVAEIPPETPREVVARPDPVFKPATKFKSPLVMNWVNKNKESAAKGKTPLKRPNPKKSA